MAAGDLYQVRLVFSNASTAEHVTTGFHIVQEGLIAPAIGSVGTAVKDWWDVAGGFGAKVYHPTEIALERVTLRRMVPEEPVEQQYTTGLPIAGVDATDPVPSQDAVIASLRTGNIGRSYRGRMYLPPIAESSVIANGSLSAAVAVDIRDRLIDLKDAFSDSLGDIDAPWVILSRRNNGVTRPTPIGTIVTQIKVDRIIRTQRRRTDNSQVYV